jgi:hypothetical protein
MGPDLKALLDCCFVVDRRFPAACADELDRDVAADQLKEVAIAADHDDRGLVGQLHGQRGEHIVCFKSCNAKNWNSKAAEKLVKPTELCDKNAWRGFPLSLVVRVEGVSERLVGRVNREGDACRLALAERLQEQDAESVQGGSRLARRGLHRRQRVERSEEDRIRIDEQDRVAKSSQV